jgi:hypothetical protein
MFTLKPLSRPGIPAALQKAERYRLLNEPWEAESICRDVLAVEPDNQAALIALILSLTDQFNRELGPDPAELKALVGRLGTEYEQLYYAAIIAERHGKARLARGGPGAGPVAYEFLRDAMDLYERAERARPAGNDSALLRWNTCARILMRHENVRPLAEERVEAQLE